MDELLTQQVIRSAVGTFFGVMGSLGIAVIMAAFKTYWDVRKLRHDMAAAFKKIRALEGEGDGEARD